MSQRDDVLAARIDLALQDANIAVANLHSLLTPPPTTGAEQEQCMRSIEESLYNINWRIQRLKEIGK